MAIPILMKEGDLPQQPVLLMGHNNGFLQRINERIKETEEI